MCRQLTGCHEGAEGDAHTCVTNQGQFDAGAICPVTLSADSEEFNGQVDWVLFG